MIAVKILTIQNGRQVVSGQIVWDGRRLSVEPATESMNRLVQTPTRSKDGRRLTSRNEPRAWLDSLSDNYRSAYLRATQVINHDEEPVLRDLFSTPLVSGSRRGDAPLDATPYRASRRTVSYAQGHKPAGSPDGGQFTSGGGGSSSDDSADTSTEPKASKPIRIKTNKKTPEHIQKIVADNVAKVEKMGLPFEGTVEIDNTYSGRAGRYLIDDDVVSVNGPTAETNADPRMKESGAEVVGWSSVSRLDHPESVVVHEIAHSLHAAALTKGADRETAKRMFQTWIKKIRPNDIYPTLDGLKVTSAGFKKFAKEVGGYAATNPLELVAEVFTGRKYGKTYSKEVDRLYEAFGGP